MYRPGEGATEYVREWLYQFKPPFVGSGPVVDPFHGEDKSPLECFLSQKLLIMNLRDGQEPEAESFQLLLEVYDKSALKTSAVVEKRDLIPQESCLVAIGNSAKASPITIIK